MSNSRYISRVRSGIGQDLLLLPGVAVVLHDPVGRLLLIRDRGSGEWGLPAGAIELGEAPETAARRELMEESGIDAGGLTLVAALGGLDFRHTYPHGDRVEYSIFVFSGVVPEAVSPNPQDREEVAEAEFFARTEAPELALPYPAEVLWAGSD